MIERQARPPIVKRQKADRLEKNARIGELLNLEKVPLHCLEWQEPKLELGTGDCYPLIDVFLRLAQLVTERPERPDVPVPVKKKPGRPKRP